MAIIRWNPMWDPFEEMQRALRDHFGSSTRGGFTPAVDMYQTDTAIIVEAPLPHIDPDKVQISVEDDILILEGQSEEKKEVDEKNYYRKEIRRGSFYRAVELPGHVEGERAEALYGNGILKITIPRAEEKKTKTIPVKLVGKS